MPSETVYGLAADALNPSACSKIFAAKGRPTSDPLIVHVASAREVSRVAQSNPSAVALAAAFWPGPLTMVLPKLRLVPDLVSAGRPTVAVRVPDHPLFRRLIRLSDRPLAAPSANPFGYISPTSAAHVRDGLAGSILRAVLDGGKCRVGVESTIVDLTDPERPRLLRPGGLAADVIELVLGKKLARPIRKTIPADIAAPAPGMLSRHYSPRTPLTLHTRLSTVDIAKFPRNEVFVFLQKPSQDEFINVEAEARSRLRWLSEHGELAEIAKNLFAMLRALDLEKWKRIHATLVPGEEGLAPAINDRLRRASAKV